MKRIKIVNRYLDNRFSQFIFISLKITLSLLTFNIPILFAFFKSKIIIIVPNISWKKQNNELKIFFLNIITSLG